MAARRTSQSTRKVKNLKVKRLSEIKAKHVKGGPQTPPWISRGSITGR